jgi:dUTP pyrophosphatase
MIKVPDLGKIKEDSDMINQFISENEDKIDYNIIYEEYGIDIKGLEDDMLNYNPKLDLGYIKIIPEATSPFYNYESDSGFDLFSTEEIVVEGLGRALIPTGLSFDIKDGYEIQVRSKSGLAINQGLMVLNSPGTVDSGYLGEVKVIIFNTNKEPFTIKKGMKIAQAVLCPVVNGKWVNLVEKNNVPTKDRGNNGFGSTGI